MLNGAKVKEIGERNGAARRLKKRGGWLFYGCIVFANRMEFPSIVQGLLLSMDLYVGLSASSFPICLLLVAMRGLNPVRTAAGGGDSIDI